MSPLFLGIRSTCSCYNGASSRSSIRDFAPQRNPQVREPGKKAEIKLTMTQGTPGVLNHVRSILRDGDSATYTERSCVESICLPTLLRDKRRPGETVSSARVSEGRLADTSRYLAQRESPGLSLVVLTF